MFLECFGVHARKLPGSLHPRVCGFLFHLERIGHSGLDGFFIGLGNNRFFFFEHEQLVN